MTELQQKPTLPTEEKTTGDNTIAIHDIIQMVIANWYWFLLSVLLCLGVAYYYLAITPPTYSRKATILVKDSRKGGDTDLTAFSDLAGFQSRRNVDNEVFILQSRRLMADVVKRLNLTTTFAVKERLRMKDLYGQSPIEIDFVDDNDKQSLSMWVTPLGEGKVQLREFSDNFITKQESARSRPYAATRSPRPWAAWSCARPTTCRRPTWAPRST